MEFFNVLKSFWNDEKVSNLDKEKSSFMINRRTALKHVYISAYLSKPGIYSGAITTFWKLFLRKNYNHYPSWFYTKFLTKTKEKKQYSINDFDSETINLFCKFNKCETKSLEQAFKFYPNEIYKEIQLFKEVV
jgi:hypothetical protein